MENMSPLVGLFLALVVVGCSALPKSGSAVIDDEPRTTVSLPRPDGSCPETDNGSVYLPDVYYCWYVPSFPISLAKFIPTNCLLKFVGYITIVPTVILYKWNVVLNCTGTEI